MRLLEDWDDVGTLLLTVAALTVFLLGAWIFCADHRVRYYYVTSDSSATSACVIADIDWSIDDKTWCSGDIDKVIDASRRLNEQLKANRSH